MNLLCPAQSLNHISCSSFDGLCLTCSSTSINSKQADLGAIGRKTDCGKEGMEDLKYSDFSLVTKLVSQQKRGQSKSTEGEHTRNAFQGLSIPVLCS